MRTLAGFVSIATLATLFSPLAIGANAHGEAFLRKSMEGNLAEIKVGQLAQQKGATEGVRHFGAVLEKDHAQANQQAMTVASSMGVAQPSAPSQMERMEYQRLASLSGRQFDRAFVKDMIKDHRKDIAEFRKEAKVSGPAADYAKASLPTLERHLHLAEALEKPAGG